MAKKRLHAFFSGAVQGVGFRFTAQRLALDLKVGGWVKNLYDGRVEIVAEGNENTLGNFLEHLKDDFQGYIKDIDIDWRQTPEGLDDFRIRF